MQKYHGPSQSLFDGLLEVKLFGTEPAHHLARGRKERRDWNSASVVHCHSLHVPLHLLPPLLFGRYLVRFPYRRKARLDESASSILFKCLSFSTVVPSRFPLQTLLYAVLLYIDTELRSADRSSLCSFHCCPEAISLVMSMNWLRTPAAPTTSVPQ